MNEIQAYKAYKAAQRMYEANPNYANLVRLETAMTKHERAQRRRIEAKVAELVEHEPVMS